MTAFTAPIRRRNYGTGHGYVDAANRKVPGVTSIIREGVPVPALKAWAANITAAYAVDNWTELSALTPDARLWRLQKVWREELSAAAVRGTLVHAYLPPLLAGETVEAPDHLSGYVASLVRFLDEWQVRAVLSEATVVSYGHGYSGTLDLIGDLIDPHGFGEIERWLIDGKTGSAVYGDTALQLAAYRYTDVWTDIDGDTPMPAVKRTGVLHIREDGYDLVPVQAGPAEFAAFLAAKRMAEFRAGSDELVGEPLAAMDIEIGEVFA
jgi:hypothetical protein